MKCKFNEIIQSIEKRKSFEELCKEIYIIDKQSKKIQFTDAGKSLSELKKIDSNIINKPCTVYEAVHQGEVTKMFPDGKVEYKLVNSNGVVMSKNTLCDNQEKALQCAEKLWRTRNEKIVWWNLNFINLIIMCFQIIICFNPRKRARVLLHEFYLSKSPEEFNLKSSLKNIINQL